MCDATSIDANRHRNRDGNCNRDSHPDGAHRLLPSQHVTARTAPLRVRQRHRRNELPRRFRDGRYLLP
jgi:hypothetical protein